MKALQVEDRLRIEAAEGWLLLGIPSEAEAELSQVSLPARAHVLYVNVQCGLAIARRGFLEALELGQRQIELDPDNPRGWLHRAYSLHELRRTDEAFECLVPAARRFPAHELIAFNLACYCCHLERFDDALSWINRTIRLTGPSKVSF